jgi:hypothetical protein
MTGERLVLGRLPSRRNHATKEAPELGYWAHKMSRGPVAGETSAAETYLPSWRRGRAKRSAAVIAEAGALAVLLAAVQAPDHGFEGA